MDQEKIGKFIAECRKNKKLTQSELAEKLGVTDKSIGNWENGRNMPDLSLFKPLCDELGITINELINGEKIKEEEYQEKFEENIINTIDYTNKKINKKNNTISILLIVFGVIISFTAMCMFESQSSWGSIYSVFGGIIALIGFGKLTRKIPHHRRLLFNFGFFGLYIILLFVIDFLGVVNIHQAPRFCIQKISMGEIIYYDAPFYDVIRYNVDEENETYKIVKNNEYTIDELFDYCYNNK